MIRAAIKLTVNSYISVNIKHFPHLVSSRLGFRWINFQLSGTNCETPIYEKTGPRLQSRLKIFIHLKQLHKFIWFLR
jgi:hypothetical protein